MPRSQLIQIRGGTAAAWTTANPVLALREMGIETDTRKHKFGDGSTSWNSLPYAGGGGSALTDGSGTTASGSSVNLGGAISSDVVIADNVVGGHRITIGADSGGDTNRVPEFYLYGGFATKSSIYISDDVAITSFGVVDIIASDATLNGDPIATQNDLNSKQNSDSDLTAIAALTPANDDLIQRKSGAWTNRTIAQIKTDFALTKSDVGLGNVDNTSDVNKPVSTATQNAINSAVEGLQNKGDCRIATTANITLSGLQTIDGVLTVALDRVLVKDQTDPKENGIYVSGAGSWTRSSDCDTGTELRGAVTSVDEGTINADTTWRQTSDNITIGSTNIVWVQFGAATPDATSTTKGKAKLYPSTSLGTNTDGAPDQNAVKAYVDTNTISKTLNSAQIIVGNASNVAAAVSVSGDVSITNAGVTTYAGTVPINKGGTGQTTKAAAYDALSPTTTQGDIEYHNGTNNIRLAVGTAGTVLTSNGTIPAWTTPNLIMLFGDGSDGDLTVTTNNATSGPITSGALTRDAYFNNLTISGSGSLRTDGFKLYVKGTLDISAAGADAITSNGRAPTSDGLANGTAGVASSAVVSATLGGAPVARNGGAGGTAAGSTPTASVAANIANGGVGGTGQAGGSGSGGSGGAASIGGTILSASFFGRYTDHLLYGANLLLGGTAGGAAGGGGGDGTAGGGGGSGGNGGGYVGIWARTINRSGSTGVGAISAKGAAGGNGGTASAGNRGGGAGGGGGGGGAIYLVYGNLTGSTATNCIDVSGSAGGNGGSGTGTGTGGRGGNGGSGGRIDTIDIILQTGTNQFGTAGTASSTVSGNAGTSGGAGDTEQKSL